MQQVADETGRLEDVQPQVVTASKLPEDFEVLERIVPANAGLVCLVVTVTPEAAAKWLGFNHQHRSINKTKVAKYAAQINDDDWKLNGKTIVFDTDGKLVGGQHRLSACVAAERPFRTVVVCGVDPSVVEIEPEKPVAKSKPKKGHKKKTPHSK